MNEEQVKNSIVPVEKGEVLEKHNLMSRLVVQNLIREAIKAMDYAYTPYSEFKVGAALLSSKQKIYKGCNIENASYTPTNCAERTAMFKAISEGDKEFVAIAVVGGKHGKIEDYTPPCGVCRQTLREFVDPKRFLVIIAKSEDDYLLYFLEELLPLSFGPENLDKK